MFNLEPIKAEHLRKFFCQHEQPFFMLRRGETVVNKELFFYELTSKITNSGVISNNVPSLRQIIPRRPISVRSADEHHLHQTRFIIYVLEPKKSAA